MWVRPTYVLVAALFAAIGAQMSADASTALSVPRYGKFEAQFSIPGMAGNPYDPAINDVEATFVNAKHAAVTIPAFWDGQTWRVRFAPLDIGRYSLSLTYNGAKIAPADLSASSLSACLPAIPASSTGIP